ncbi:DUF6364 family protein [Ignisphaera sp. 4213-co]|uniref:DUF6364 family protein n=1 Tax=Ignisphaera cupida TaxID=3050454 RepID=A0ABD4Z9Z5_9CREN|nr:DUF6364 family protein [Ignisphaera sp. 4213-co]MDK6028913.1 DUF6364 family protein [Ignisphaera sp. 4213-co]
MSKKKLTLSVRRDLIDEVRRAALGEGKTLSGLVEEYLEFLALESWVTKLAKDLELGDLETVFDQEVVSSRPRGLDAASVVRELRDERAGIS